MPNVIYNLQSVVVDVAYWSKIRSIFKGAQAMRMLVKMIGVALVAASALPFTAGNALAVPITVAGTTSFTTIGTSGVVSVSNLLPTFSFPLSVGGSSTHNLLTITPAPGDGTAS